MPLAFPSASHGTIAFGFFNIETDMLLLQHDFFFADTFCSALLELEQGGDARMEAWQIVDPRRRGDLHGAIAGEVLDGFIGATYQRWPFPAAPSGFKQNPRGGATQSAVRQLIEPFGKRVELRVRREAALLAVGEHQFTDEQLGLLVEYVDCGGFPRWRDDLRPDYVRELVRRLIENGSVWASAVLSKESALQPRGS